VVEEDGITEQPVEMLYQEVQVEEVIIMILELI
jgi:hypothetical protein